MITAITIINSILVVALLIDRAITGKRKVKTTIIHLPFETKKGVTPCKK